MAVKDEDTRAVTAAAVVAVTDMNTAVPEAARRGRAALSGLPGLVNGDALASALLYVAAPDRMAVYDRRVQRALGLLSIELSNKPRRYSRCMTIVEGIRTDVDRRGTVWIARDVDLALYNYGGCRAA
jgi:hypothetical protein